MVLILSNLFSSYFVAYDGYNIITVYLELRQYGRKKVSCKKLNENVSLWKALSSIGEYLSEYMTYGQMRRKP